MAISPSRIIALLALVLVAWIMPEPPARQGAATIDQVSPVDCPSSGCAPGQRINFIADFDITEADPASSPNLQVCVFQPASWPAPSSAIDFNPKGAITGQDYTAGTTRCNQPPSGYTVIGGATATLPITASYDILGFAFRLGATPATSEPFKVLIYELDVNGNWVLTSQGSKTVAISPGGTTVYVANDALACETRSPCYVNTKDDLADGIGTGLKDALDFSSSAATIHIVGDYVLKQNTVLVNKAHTLKSLGTGRIITNSLTCAQPMLSLTTNATLSGLAIDASACTSTRRDLIQVNVNGTNSVLVENSDLLGGKDALKVLAGNTANLVVRGNQIASHSGYAIWVDAANTGGINAFGNNLVDNRPGVQVECGSAARGTVDHNFWGVGLSVAQSSNQCTGTETKRLGAAVLHNPTSPGLQVEQVTVGTTAHYSFNNAIGFQRTGTGDDFDLIVVNHGADNVSSIPFTIGQSNNLKPCSSYWDVFLAGTTAPASPVTLELFFKYNLSSDCVAAVEAAQYCGQTATPANYPLWWYDLTGGAWKTTASGNGQTTTCRTDTKEIQVSITANTRRPNFTDLAREPFVVGIPGSPPSIVLTSLNVEPGNTQATLRWVTSSEVNLSGYFVQRSTQATTDFADITTLIARQGTGTGGSSYQYTNTGLTNYTRYYYRVRAAGSDGSSIYSNIVATTPIPQTPTPTYTLTPSLTPTRSIYTATITIFPTSTYLYRTPTRTPTATFTPTSPFKTITVTPTPSATSLTRSATSTPTQPTATITIDPATVLAQTRAVRTQIVQLSMTVTPSITPTSPPPDDLEVTPPTIAMALLALAGLSAGGFYLLWERHRKI